MTEILSFRPLECVQSIASLPHTLGPSTQVIHHLKEMDHLAPAEPASAPRRACQLAPPVAPRRTTKLFSTILPYYHINIGHLTCRLPTRYSCPFHCSGCSATVSHFSEWRGVCVETIATGVLDVGNCNIGRLRGGISSIFK